MNKHNQKEESKLSEMMVMMTMIFTVQSPEMISHFSEMMTWNQMKGKTVHLKLLNNNSPDIYFPNIIWSILSCENNCCFMSLCSLYQ